MTQPLYESCLNWVPDPKTPTPRCLDNPTSPTAVTTDPASPSEAHPKLPGRSRQRRRRKRKAAATANENSAPRTADRSTPPTLSANRNSARWASSKARQPMRSTPVEHSKASPPLRCHSTPSQRPIRIQDPHLARTTLKSEGFISRPKPTPDRKHTNVCDVIHQ